MRKDIILVAAAPSKRSAAGGQFSRSKSYAGMWPALWLRNGGMVIASGKYQLRMLGSFAFFSVDGSRIPVTSKRACALIALLAMTPTGERSRVWLQSMLWGNRAIEQAQASLRRELSNLVTLLDAHGAGNLVTRGASQARLDLDRIDVDALTVAPRLPNDVTLTPTFLEGFDLPGCDEFEDWLRAQRRRIEDIQATVIEAPLAGSSSAQVILGGPLPPRRDLVGAKPPPLAPKPSIAILPFESRGVAGGDITDRGLMFAEAVGMSLASYPHIFVVSTSSAAALRQRGQVAGEIAVMLGVQYLMEGSLSESADQVRVAVRLIDGATGIQRWASNFGRPGCDLVSLQEEVAQAIAPQIWTQIDLAERHRGLSRPSQINDSYHLYWRANALLHQWTAASIREALSLTEELVALEPDSGWAASLCAFCNAAAFSAGWADHPEASRRLAQVQFQNALRLEPDNVEVMGYCAGTLALTGGNLRVADHLIERALSLFPAYQPSLFWGGWVDLANRRPERASERFELSLRINPVSGVRAYAITGIGLARLMMGEVDDAYALLFEAYIHIPHYALTVAGLYMAARMKGDEAVVSTIAARLERGIGLERVFALFPDPAHRELLESALAGLTDNTHD